MRAAKLHCAKGADARPKAAALLKCNAKSIKNGNAILAGVRRFVQAWNRFYAHPGNARLENAADAPLRRDTR